MPITLNGDGAISGLTTTGISAVQNVPATSVITTLNSPTGVLATQNGMTGIAKAWVNINAGATSSIRGSFNVSSITRNSAGNITINFTTAMPNINYVVTATPSSDNAAARYVYIAGTSAVMNVNSFTVQAVNSAGNATDADYVGVAVLGS